MTHVLAMVAHPDDEVLGAGGTLARHAGAGDESISFFSPTASVPRGDDPSAAERRGDAARQGSVHSRRGTTDSFSASRTIALDRIDLLDIVPGH